MTRFRLGNIVSTSLLALVLSATACVVEARGRLVSPALDEDDLSAIRAVHDDYSEGWLQDDRRKVMSTLTEDAVLLPSGLDRIEGAAAIEAYWWPADAPATRILSLTLNVEKIDGSGDIAYAVGTGALSFSYVENGETKTSAADSTFLDVMRKGADGRWRIAVRMWSNRRR
jgi:uncharacterized protein (TIGR02246 family)